MGEILHGMGEERQDVRAAEGAWLECSLPPPGHPGALWGWAGLPRTGASGLVLLVALGANSAPLDLHFSLSGVDLG